jgi:hypothetical protein
VKFIVRKLGLNGCRDQKVFLAQLGLNVYYFLILVVETKSRLHLPIGKRLCIGVVAFGHKIFYINLN